MSNDCPHFTDNEDGTIECAVLRRFGFTKIAGAAMRNHPCDACRSGWVNREPPIIDDRGRWSGHLNLIVGDRGPLRREAGPPLPSIPQMIANFGASMAKWAASGFRTVPQATFERRLATCSTCEQWDGARLRCRKCGCKQIKLHLATERCPLGKWDRE